MRKHLSFAIAAAIVGLAIVFWVKASVVETNADVVQPNLAVHVMAGAGV